MSTWLVSDKQISVVLDTAVALGLLELENVQSMGQSIWNSNARSVAHCYREEAARHKFKVVASDPVSPVQAYKYARCIVYQSCEHPQWETEAAYWFLAAFCLALEGKLGLTADQIKDSAEYEQTRWSLD